VIAIKESEKGSGRRNLGA